MGSAGKYWATTANVLGWRVETVSAPPVMVETGTRAPSGTNVKLLLLPTISQNWMVPLPCGVTMADIVTGVIPG